MRDAGSAINAAIESIATRDTVARRIIREAERRGFDTAAHGAPWIWNFADEHFPDATQIDIFHAKGHLFEVAKAIYANGSEIPGSGARNRRGPRR